MSLPSSEQWRPVPGYEGLYEVSDQGRVRSRPRPSTRGGILTQFVGVHGYVRINLSKDGSQWRTCAHRLVMLAFVGPRPEGMEIRHLNGDPTDNRLANLAYGTSSENKYDKVRHGTDHQARKTHCPAGHAYDEANTRVERGRRHCRICGRQNAAQSRALRRKAAA